MVRMPLSQDLFAAYVRCIQEIRRHDFCNKLFYSYDPRSDPSGPKSGRTDTHTGTYSHFVVDEIHRPLDEFYETFEFPLTEIEEEIDKE